MSEPIKTLETVMRELRDRANEPEYKLHREWAIDQCANELQPVRDALWGRVDKWRETTYHPDCNCIWCAMEAIRHKCADELAAILGEREG